MELLVAVLLGTAILSHADNLYVDPTNGNDAATGLRPEASFKTIAKAVRVAKPGDTIHLAKTEFREQVFFYDKKSGEPGKPITIDGHGALIQGAVPLEPAKWKRVSPGLWAGEGERLFQGAMRPKDMKNVEWVAAFTSRFSFVFDGALNRMNHSVKAPAVAWKKPEDLKPGEWTYQAPSSRLLGTYYIRIAPPKTLADYKIEMPWIISAVQISGDVRHLLIKNLSVTHVLNDGFALTVGNDPANKIRDIVYENIRAVECCDDGLSAHGDCEVTVNGFEAAGCGTGIASSGSSVNRGLFIHGTHGVDLLFGGGRHVIKDSRVISSAHSAVIGMDGCWYKKEPALATCTLRLNNVLVAADQRAPLRADLIRVSAADCKLELDHCTLFGLSVLVKNGGALKFTHSILAGGAGRSISVLGKSRWEADRNLYDIESIKINDACYAAKDFDAYRRATGQDAASRWAATDGHAPLERQERPELNAHPAGADPALLPKPCAGPLGQYIDRVQPHVD